MVIEVFVKKLIDVTIVDRNPNYSYENTLWTRR
jgi:hypothetical protein